MAGAARAQGVAPAPQGLAPPALAEGVLNVRDFGARGDGTADDARAIGAAIQASITKGQGGTVFLPAGTYLMRTVTQGRGRPIYTTAADGIDLSRIGYAIRAHLLLAEVTGLTLLGEPGARLVLKDATAAGLWLDRCDDITVRGLSIDYDPLPFAQGTIVAADAAARTFEWKVESGYLEPPNGYLAHAFEPVSDNTRGPGVGSVFAADGALKFGAGSGSDVFLGAMTERGGGVYRAQSTHALAALAVGDRFAWAARAPTGASAVTLTLSNRCQFEAVTVHSSPGTAFLAHDCDQAVFRNCVVDRLAGTNRLYGANAGGVQARSNRRGPTVEGCRFAGHGDDSVVAVQTAQRLLAVTSAIEMIVEFDQFQLFRPGDRIAVISQATGMPRGEARVRDATVVRFRDRTARKLIVDRAPPALSADALGFEQIPPPAEGRDRATSPAQRPDVVVDLDLAGTGLVIRNNVFSSHRGNGVRIAGTDGLIENNSFENLGGCGVRMGMDLSWPEAPGAQRMVVRNNTFRGLSNAANIWLHARLGNYEQAQTTGNQDITIEANAFDGFGARTGGPAAAIAVSNGQTVRIRNNTVGAPDASLMPAPRAVQLDLCRDVTVEGNTIVQRDAAVDPIQVTARADRASVRVRNNRLTR